MGKPYRNRLEIIGEILMYCQTPKPILGILRTVDLSYTLTRKYLNLLISADLLACRKEKNKKLHQTTLKGEKYVLIFKQYGFLKDQLLNEITNKALVENKLATLLCAVKAN